MVKPKRPSKRVPLARKYNIQKKVKEHDRKERRDAKKNPAKRKKLSKDPGIPNLNPFKAQILRKLENQQQKLRESERARQRNAYLLAMAKKSGQSLSDLVSDATSRGDAYNEMTEENQARMAAGIDRFAPNRAGESTRRAFFRHVKSVIEKSDIILEVLDARDPLSCRAHAVEALALAQNPPKRVILVLNKIDLVPAEVVRQWLTYLRREFPTIAFKASTQQQRSNLNAPGGAGVNKATKSGEVVTGSGAAGVDTLIQLIKNYSRNNGIKTAVTVGVLGYPNVGKSSLINSLKRSKAVGVSSHPGFTKTTQEIAIDSKVTLLDCPGVIFDDDSRSSDDAGDSNDHGAGLLLRNCISVDQIEDPEGAVEGIFNRCAPEKLMAIYSIASFSNATEFLNLVAMKKGKLGRGGVPDRSATARAVLHDWNSGKIPFFVLPPSDDSDVEMDDSNVAEELGAAKIVSEWSKELDIDSLIAGADDAVLSGHFDMAEDGAADYIAMKSNVKGLKKGATGPLIHSKHMKLAAMIAGADDEEDEDDEDDVDMDFDEDDDSEEDDEEIEGDNDEMDETEVQQALKSKKTSKSTGKNKKAYDFDEFL